MLNSPFVGKTKVRKGTSAAALQGGTPEVEASIRLWEDIKKLARHFQLFGSPFFSSDLLSVAPPDFKSDDPIHYSNPDYQVLGKTAELYESVPEKYHYFMSVAQSTKSDSDSFIKTVSLKSIR